MKKGLHQYPGGVQDPNTSPPSPQLTGEELNTLSYLVRKYPKEAAEHLTTKDIEKEVKERGGVPAMTDEEIIDECLKRHIIQI